MCQNIHETLGNHLVTLIQMGKILTSQFHWGLQVNLKTLLLSLYDLQILDIVCFLLHKSREENLFL